LHLEDSVPDHALALAAPAARRPGGRLPAGRDPGRTCAALASNWDVVLSDYNLPGFSGLRALQLLQARWRRGGLVPFILVSGQIGEDTAVAAMRNGAATTCSRTTWRAWRRRWNTPSPSDAAPRPPRRPTASWPNSRQRLQRTGPAPADQRREPSVRPLRARSTTTWVAR
jgi:CheY-like chemotaxis protein